MARAILRVCFKGLEQKRHTLAGKKIVVGRDPQCGIVVDNQSISARHFELLGHGPNHWVKDLGSANGTYVNGKRVDTVCLRNLDEIVVGKYTLVYENAQASSKDLASKPLPADAADESLQDNPDERKSSRSTYVMDHAAVQAYVAQMSGTGREASSSGGRSKPAPPSNPDSGSAQRARQEVSSLRKVMYLLAGLVTLLVVAVVYLVYLQLK